MQTGRFAQNRSVRISLPNFRNASGECGVIGRLRQLPCLLSLLTACCAFSSVAPAQTNPDATLPAVEDDAAPRKPAADFAEDMEARKSYAIPAYEVLGFGFLLNQTNRRYLGNDYKSTVHTIGRNLRSGWVVDDDPFATNQLGHPYLGTMFHGFARSSGLTFWESMGYAFGGSALWEVAGENTRPSRNDQIATGIGGAFLGEALFRLSSLMLEHGGSAPPLWRKVGATFISPSNGFNRFAFGDKLAPLFASHDPAYYSRVSVGFSGTAKVDQGTSATQLKANEALLDYSIDYGMPGKSGYTYTRPFDYFHFHASASSANGVENVLTYGLLLGRDYQTGKISRGVWGLYGSFDYIAPQIYRISSTSVALGTTNEWRLGDDLALQSSALLGMGYAAVGTTRTVNPLGEYHYGIAPQTLLAARLIFADRSAFDVTIRDYFVSHAAGANRSGHDNIVRIDASYTIRVNRRHAFTVKYLGNRRNAYFPDTGSQTQSRATIGLFYTFLGQDGFGRIDWQ